MSYFSLRSGAVRDSHPPSDIYHFNTSPEELQEYRSRRLNPPGKRLGFRRASEYGFPLYLSCRKLFLSHQIVYHSAVSAETLRQQDRDVCSGKIRCWRKPTAACLPFRTTGVRITSWFSRIFSSLSSKDDGAAPAAPDPGSPDQSWHPYRRRSDRL